MPILSQPLKSYNSETVCLFKLKYFVEIYFDQLYLGSTIEVLGINQLITINMLSTPRIENIFSLFRNFWSKKRSNPS
jgi:hypothetical protein